MVRNLDGEIYYWNSSAEQRYGWTHRQALGNVSHNLLETVFPEPLDAINNELFKRGFWKGELIHTRSDGSKVKVLSTWELYRDSQGRLCTVLEVNENFLPLNPASAFVTQSSRPRGLRALWKFLQQRKAWWLTPIILLLGMLLGVVLFTHSVPHIPTH